MDGMVKTETRRSQTTVLTVDTLDDRREVHELLRKLSPARRVGFLAWCCKHSKMNRFNEPIVVARKTRELAELARWDSSADNALTVDVYMSCWSLAMQFQLDLDKALAKLVEMVRKPS